jgi:hypothetical protein
MTESEERRGARLNLIAAHPENLKTGVGLLKAGIKRRRVAANLRYSFYCDQNRSVLSGMAARL